MKLYEVESSIVFSTTFGHRHVGETCADSGADGNIMDSDTLQTIQNSGVEVEVMELQKPRVFEMARRTREQDEIDLHLTGNHRYRTT